MASKLMLSYSDAKRLFNKHKFRRAGKYPPQAPIDGESVWLIADGDDYELAIHECLIGIFTPGNTFRFTASPLQVKGYNSTLCSRIPEYVPFFLKPEPKAYCPSVCYAGFAAAPDYVHLFKGLTYDLTRGKWVNPRSYYGVAADRYDPVHALIKNFRQELELRIKLGAYNKLCDELNSAIRLPEHIRPRWSEPKYITELVHDMKNGVYRGEGVKHLTESIRYGASKPVLWFKPISYNVKPPDILDIFDNVADVMRLEICKLCGVYGDDEEL